MKDWRNDIVQWAFSSIRTPGLVVTIMLASMAPLLASHAAEAAKLELIGVSTDARGFMGRDSGGSYIPFGTNYYDPHTGWAPKLWRQFDPEKVRRHFGVMKGLGVNCARVFLTAGSFQPNAETVEGDALEKLDTLVRIARDNGIRLLLTGPDHWEGQPAYWRPDRFSGDNALKAVEHFWDVLGRRYRGEPAIFAWDLLNEPHIPFFLEQWRARWDTWLRRTYGTWDVLNSAWGDALTESDKWGRVGVPENKAKMGDPRLRDWQAFREHLADEWVRRQVEAIRKADPTHLVTVGYIQWSYPLVRPGEPGRYAAFNPRRQARWLDFVTIHFYPTLGSPFQSDSNWQKNLDYLQAASAYCRTGKPVILGEFGWYGGGAPQNHPFLSEEQQARWIASEIEASRGLVDGWLSWPFADSPDSRDISLFSGLVKPDMTIKAWGRKFQTYASNLPQLKAPAFKPPVFDFPDALTAGTEELRQMHQAYGEAIQTVMHQAHSGVPATKK